MKVIFQFKENDGNIFSHNNIEKELSEKEILVILKSKEITFPVNTGIIFTSKHCMIENSNYYMFTEPYKLIITLKEIDNVEK